MSSLAEFDENRFYLGRLCKRGHDWNGTGRSLRRKNHRACILCFQEQNRKSYWKYREQRVEQGRIYYQMHKEEVLQRCAKYYLTHKEDYKRRQSEHLKTPARRETIRKYMKKFRQTPQGRSAIARARFKRRTRQRNNHHVSYTHEQIVSLFNTFNETCAYCGSTDSLTIDHFIPLSVGGSDNLGNFVPACTCCNVDKRDHDPLTWYKSKSFFCSERLEKILLVLGKTETNYNQLPLF